MWTQGNILLPDCMGSVETLAGYGIHFLYLKNYTGTRSPEKRLALWPGINVVVLLACFISTLDLS